MKIAFAKSVAAAAAAGLMGVACGGGGAEPEVPETPAADGAGDEMGDEMGDDADDEMGDDMADEGGEAADGEKACCKGQNECQGKGGCKVDGSHDCKGMNECKGKGGCNAHCPEAGGE